MEEPLEFMIDDSGEWSRKMEHLSKSTNNKNLYVKIYIYTNVYMFKIFLYFFDPTSISEVDIAPIKCQVPRKSHREIEKTYLGKKIVTGRSE